MATSAALSGSCVGLEWIWACSTGMAGPASQAPQQQQCPCRHDHPEQTADSCQPEPKVGNEMSVFSDSEPYCPNNPEYTYIRLLPPTVSKLLLSRSHQSFTRN